MSGIVRGPRAWELKRDLDGHREYRLTVRVETASSLDGPAVALLTPGLPTPGSVWAVDNDYDPWAFCQYDAEVKPVVENEPNTEWDITFLFTTKPAHVCWETDQKDPLLQPMFVSGGFSNQHVEGVVDRFGRAIKNSAHEQIRGSINEWAVSYPIIKIKQNVAALQLNLLASMIDLVNDTPMWGVQRREIRLASVSWEQKFYGTCSYYYERNLEFHVKYGTFDRNILDESSKVLNGHWDAITGNWVLDKIAGVNPDPSNPSHFIDFTDRNGNPIRGVLNGRGVPAKVAVAGTNNKTQYVSITNGNVGRNLSDTRYWIVLDNLDDIQPWDDSRIYQKGELVTLGSDVYVATVNVPDPTTDPSANPDEWAVVTPLLDRGVYSASTTYARGQYVTPAPGTADEEGRIHVEYYDEANFLLLGVPLSVGL